jgi:hypothetical protein
MLLPPPIPTSKIPPLSACDWIARRSCLVQKELLIVSANAGRMAKAPAGQNSTQRLQFTQAASSLVTLAVLGFSL